MTAAAARTPRVSVPDRPWWVPDESPGGIGSPELWMDYAAMDDYGEGRAAPAVTVSRASPLTWIDAIVRFNAHPGLADPVLYLVESRRTSPANQNRPYYVLKRPD